MTATLKSAIHLLTTDIKKRVLQRERENIIRHIGSKVYKIHIRSVYTVNLDLLLTGYHHTKKMYTHEYSYSILTSDGQSAQEEDKVISFVRLTEKDILNKAYRSAKRVVREKFGDIDYRVSLVNKDYFSSEHLVRKIVQPGYFTI